jgi:hypothetical protein
MRKSGVIVLFRELRSIFIIMEDTLGHFAVIFIRRGVEFNEIQPKERIVIINSVITLLQGLLHMKAQTNAFKLETADTSRRRLRHFYRTVHAARLASSCTIRLGETLLIPDVNWKCKTARGANTLFLVLTRRPVPANCCLLCSGTNTDITRRTRVAF